MTDSGEPLTVTRTDPGFSMPWLIQDGKQELALQLVRQNPHLLHARFSGNNTLLLLSAQYRLYALADEFLSMGAKLDFIAAIALGRLDSVRMMLSKDPRLVHKCSPDRFSAIHVAVWRADSAMLALLISAGANVNDNRNPKRLTPLFFAWKEPHENAAFLLAQGADIDARRKHGFTVLHSAARSGNLRFAKFLIAHHASPNIQTNGRQTPWALAVRHGHRDVAAFLASI